MSFSQSSFKQAARNELKIIHAGRFICACIVLMFAVSDPNAPGVYFEIDDVSSALYTAYSLALILMCKKFWFRNFSFFNLFIFVDFAFILVVPPFVEPKQAGFIVSIILTLCILLESWFRWRMKGVVLSGIACFIIVSISSELFLAVEAVRPSDYGNFYVAENFVRRAVISAAMIGGFIWFLRNVDFSRAPEFASYGAESFTEMMEETLKYAVGVTGARRGTLCWSGGDSGCFSTVSEGIAPSEKAALARCCAGGPSAMLRPFMFDGVGRRGIALRDGPFGLNRMVEIADDDFLDAFDSRQMLVVPFTAKSGRGTIFLSEPVISWLQLDFARSIGAEVALAFDRLDLEMFHRQSAVSNLRSSLARDLHDSVAQTLTGVRFWINGVRKRAEQSRVSAADFDQLLAVLEDENRHIRDMIAQLETGSLNLEVSELVKDLRAVVANASVQWNFQAQLHTAQEHIEISRPDAFSVQQMVREALANAARHGNATSVGVDCLVRDDQLLVVITDDGTGFGTGESDVLPRSIVERATRMGGGVAILSRRHPTRIRITLPMTIGKEHDE